MLTSLEKHLRKELDEPIGLALNNPGPGMWGRVIVIYQRTVEDGEVLLHKRARTFDLNEQEQAELVVNLRRQAWVLLTKKVQEESVDGMMLLKLRNRFEEKFRMMSMVCPVFGSLMMILTRPSARLVMRYGGLLLCVWCGEDVLHSHVPFIED